MSRKRIKTDRLNNNKAVPVATLLQKNMKEKHDKAKMKEVAGAQAEMLARVSEEMGYTFAGLGVANKEMEFSFRKGFDAAVKIAMKQFEGREDEEGMQTAMKEATGRVVVVYNQQCINTGVLVKRNINLLEIPKARVFPDGRVEAANTTDTDIRQIIQETRVIAAKFNVLSAVRGDK